MKNLFLLLIVATSLFSLPLYADFKGTLEFSEFEKVTHKQRSNELAFSAANCLQDYKREHIEFYNSHCRWYRGRRVCLSKFYGDQRYTKSQLQSVEDHNNSRLTLLSDELRKYGFSPRLVDEMESMSCVGMALKCLERAFFETNQEEVWRKIKKFTKLNAVDGNALQEGLRRLGWRVLYWNPTEKNDVLKVARLWDKEEIEWQSKGYHAYRWIIMNRTSRYYDNVVDDWNELLGFGTGTPSFLKSIPFWVGTAHTGFHVFPGTFEQVIEAHSLRSIIDPSILEFSFFAPMNQNEGGGPKWFARGKYRSGLIAVPPGF